jgi:hypothetical protein
MAHQATPQASTSALPQPTLGAGTSLVLSAGDLRELVKQISNVVQSGHSGPSNEKDLKFAEQAPFSGKAEALDPLLREAEVCFSVQSRIYDSPTKKAFYILSLFKNGNALLWKEQYL